MGDLRIDASDLDREKPRIFAELSNMFARMPALAARNLARERVRPTPADGRKGGVPEHVRAITLDEVRSRWQRYYKPTNAILALAGGFDPEAARSVIERHFADLPPGAPAPPAQSPGRPRLGPPEQVSVRAVQPTAPAQACLAFPAPAPGSKEYAPFLVLVGRMWRAAGPQAGAGQITVYYTPIDDPSWVGVASSLRTGETTEEAVARLESFISVATEPELDPSEILMTKNTFGFFLRTADIPDSVLTQNPYSVAFSLARRTQLGLDPQKLTKAIDSVRAPDLRRVAKTIFAQDRRAAVVVIPEAQKGREEN